MQSGQMLLVVGALALFGTLSLSINQALLGAETTAIQTRAAAAAIALSQSKLEARATQDFAALGLGQIETDSVTTALAVFRCTTRVDYVAAGALDSVVTGPTGLKRIQVRTASDYLPTPIALAAVVGQF